MTNTHPLVTVTSTNLLEHGDILFFTHKNIKNINNQDKYLKPLIVNDEDDYGKFIYEHPLAKEYTINYAFYLDRYNSQPNFDYFLGNEHYYFLTLTKNLVKYNDRDNPVSCLFVQDYNNHKEFNTINYDVNDIIHVSPNEQGIKYHTKYSFNILEHDRPFKMIGCISYKEYSSSELNTIFTSLINIAKDHLNSIEQ